MKSDTTLKRVLQTLTLPALGPSTCRFLTEEDRKRIRWALAHTPKGKPRRIVASPESINEFIAHLDLYCEAKKAGLDHPPSIGVREERRDILKACMRTLTDLKKIERGKLPLWHNDTLDHVGAGGAVKDPTADFICQILQDAWGAVGPLQKFATTLKAYHDQEEKRVGRKVADSDHFIRSIATIYVEYLAEKPNVSKTGPFLCVLQAVLDILGLPSEDPSRAIRAALK